MRIYKEDVDSVLESFEVRLFGQKGSDMLHVGTRMQVVFTELYLKDSHPASVSLLKDSYTLLKSNGYYYTDDK